MFSDEAGLTPFENDSFWPDLELTEASLNPSTLFEDISGIDLPDSIFSKVDSQVDKQPSDGEATKLSYPFPKDSKDFSIQRRFSTPIIKHSSQPTNTMDTNIKPSKTFLSFYHNMISDFEKLPEGKKRHISAPYDDEFVKLCTDESLKINARADGFIPKKFWDKNPVVTFGWALTNFFQRKNNANSRFLYKLHNALLLDTLYPELSPYIGVSWLDKNIIRVNKHIFGRFIGVKTVNNSLFHQQGNFPSHGFVEISSREVPSICPKINLEGVDFDNIRILMHTRGVFVQGCTESQITNFQNKK